MPRPSKPVSINKKRLTKAEKEFRLEQESKLKTGNKLIAYDDVKNDKIAYKEFLRLRKMFVKLDFIDSLDEQIINRYCKEISRKNNIEVMLQKMQNKLNEDSFMTNTQYSDICKSIDSLNKTITNINNMLLKYEDRLFLNPFSRMKAVPKTPPKESKDANAYLFGE